MRKLTDVELSMVLSRHADGKLTHWSFGYAKDESCGCVGGTVAPMEIPLVIPKRATDISYAIGHSDRLDPDYPADTDEMLRLLEKAGLC